MSDESKLTLDTIYAAWRAVGADVAGLDWAKFVGHIAAQAPAEGDAAPWSKTVESAALLLQRCTGLELQDCENLAGTILGMAANVQPKGGGGRPRHRRAVGGRAVCRHARRFQRLVAELPQRVACRRSRRDRVPAC